MLKCSKAPIRQYNWDMTRFLIAAAVFLLWSFLPAHPVHAADYKADYTVGYFVTDEGNAIRTKAQYKIALTSLTSESYVKTFSLSFPKSFKVTVIKASDDHGPISPKVEESATKTIIHLTFTKPATSRGTTNNLYLDFYQDNIVRPQGRIWEVVIPTIPKDENTTYKIILNLPKNQAKPLSLAKPAPDIVQGTQFVWNNVTTRTLYAIFGDHQAYSLQLTYPLKNSHLEPQTQEIAFPPDTAYQKVFMKSIEPAPSSVRLDEDGNYLGKYTIAPFSSKKVTVKALVQVVATPRADYARKVSSSYLQSSLETPPLWRLEEPATYNKLTDISQVYRYVVNALSYDFQKAAKGGGRVGAQAALDNPTHAVCTEFTDSFVAIARSRAIAAREVAGYAFANQPEFRPLSLEKDILHAWPEYYDNKKNVWVPVDPTWEATSGVDYFSSLDLHHIAFVLHGRDPENPRPPGAGGDGTTKHIVVEVSQKEPRERKDLTSTVEDLAIAITEKTQRSKIQIVNKGNTFAYDIPIKIEASKNIALSSYQPVISALAPYQTAIVPFEYKLRNRTQSAGATLGVVVDGRKVATKRFGALSYTNLVAWGLVAAAFFGCVIYVVTRGLVQSTTRR